MTVIQWARQGGRRYPQVASPGFSALGVAWPSIGAPRAPVVVLARGIFEIHHRIMVLGL